MRKKVLVTGGAGFIGSHLCEKLLTFKNSVLCLDDLTTGNIKNINHLLKNKLFKFIQQDSNIPLKLKVDEIYHLASPTDPSSVKKYSYETLLTNTVGTSNLLDLAEKNKAKFLFTSTVKVSGDYDKAQPYIQGKKAGEFLCMKYEHIGTKIARLKNAYGPRMKIDDSRVIPTFISKCLRNEELSIWNGGNQIDSFCYIDDIIDALISLMESDYSGTFEFGYSGSITIYDLAMIIINKTNSKSPIKTNEINNEIDNLRKISDIRAAKEYLKWEPKINLEIGLERTIEYFKGLMKNVE